MYGGVICLYIMDKWLIIILPYYADTKIMFIERKNVFDIGNTYITMLTEEKKATWVTYILIYAFRVLSMCKYNKSWKELVIIISVW